MGLACAANLPVVVVGDIDRGGLFASLYGTLALLGGEDQALVGGFMVNKFRGDAGVLAPGLVRMSELTGRPFFGTLPWMAAKSGSRSATSATVRTAIARAVGIRATR